MLFRHSYSNPRTPTPPPQKKNVFVVDCCAAAFFKINIFSLQALTFELVQYLLNLLNGALKAVENPAATKAQIVKALKAMLRDLTYGVEVREAQFVFIYGAL